MANKIESELTIEERDALRSIQKVVKALGIYEKAGVDASKKVTESTKKATSAFDVLKGVLGAQAIIGGLRTLTNVAVSGFSKIASSAISLEQVQTQFVTLTGSVSQAEKTIKELQDFTATTPFQFPGVASAAQRLLSFGFTTQEITPLLRELGDVAAGSGADLGELALIFGQVQAAGKLTGERLLQFQERAIPIGPALAESLGVAESSIKDLVSEGKVSFEEFRKAFETLNDSGNIFFEGTIRQSKTLGGILSTVSDNVDLAFSNLGQALLPIAKIIGVEVVKAFQELQRIFTANQAAIKTFIEEGVISLGNSLAETLQVVETFGRIFQEIFNGVQIVVRAAALGIIRALQGIVGAVQGVGSLVGIESETVNVAFDALTASAKELTAAVNTDIDQVGEGFKRNASIIGQSADFVKVKTAEVKAAIEESNIQPTADPAAPQAGGTDAPVRDPEEDPQIIFERQKIALINQLKEEQALLEQERAVLRKEEETLDGAAAVENLKKQKELENQIQQNARNQNKTNELKNRKDLDAINQQFDRRAIDQKIKVAQQEKQLDELAIKTQSAFLDAGLALAKKGSAEQKALQTAQAVISTFTAANQALSSPPGPPFTIPLVAAVVAKGFANVRAIQSQKFADGGIVEGPFTTGDRIPVFANAGELILNRAQQANIAGQLNSDSLAREIGQLKNAIAAQPVEVVIDGQMVAKAVRQAQEDGIELL